MEKRVNYKIGISGRLRSGKDTVAKMFIALFQSHGIEMSRAGLAEPIYEEAKSFYVKNGLVWRKNRRLLEGIGGAFNDDYPKGDKLLEIFNNTYANSSANIVVPDVRRMKQADWFIKKGFPVIRVVSDKKIRKDRCKPGEFQEGHSSDFEMDKYKKFTYSICNEGGIEDLYTSVKGIFEKIFNEK